VEFLTDELITDQGRTYHKGDLYLCLTTLAQALFDGGKARIVCGGRLDRAAVRVYYPARQETRTVPLFRPWDEPHPLHLEAGPIKLYDSDLYLRCALRHPTEQVRELFDLSPLTAGPGYEFFTSYAVLWHRVEGKFCIGPDIFSEPVWGSSEAPLLLFFPQIPRE
jgi:hypothetical protein